MNETLPANHSASLWTLLLGNIVFFHFNLGFPCLIIRLWFCVFHSLLILLQSFTSSLIPSLPASCYTPGQTVFNGFEEDSVNGSQEQRAVLGKRIALFFLVFSHSCHHIPWEWRAITGDGGWCLLQAVYVLFLCRVAWDLILLSFALPFH